MKSLQDEVMSCEAFVELVTEYVEEAMPARQKASFEQHMHFCEGCVTYLEQIRTTSALTASLAAKESEAPVAPETLDALVAVFRRLRPPGEGR